MGKRSKNKGKVGEREAAALLREFGFEARRGQQFSGGNDSPDIIHDLSGFHIEVKRCEKSGMYDWLAQATADAKPGEKPIVLHRKNNKDWLVVMDAREFLAMLANARAGL